MNAPARYTKRPVTVEAMQWDGTAEGAIPILQWIDDSGATANYRCVDLNDALMCDGGDELHTIAINTLEGTMHAVAGWWVIRGVKGEFYPCDPEVFAASYDAAAAPGGDRCQPVTVHAYGLTREAWHRLFDRVAEVAHAEDEEISCDGNMAGCSECVEDGTDA